MCPTTITWTGTSVDYMKMKIAGKRQGCDRGVRESTRFRLRKEHAKLSSEEVGDIAKSALSH